MARKEDLEGLLRDSYEIIAENQQIIQESPDLPAQRKRAKRQIDQHWGYIENYLKEYLPLALTIQAEVPTDIVQMMARFPAFVTQVTQITNREKILEVAAVELLHQIKQAETNRSLTNEPTDLRDYGYELAELRSLIEQYRSEIANLKYLRHEEIPRTINLRAYITEVKKEFEEWGKKYTSLRLTHELRLTAWYGEIAKVKSDAQRADLSVKEAFKRHSNMIILGEPGSGKTTSLKHVALEYANVAEAQLDATKTGKSDCKIPVFIQLAGYTDRVALGLAKHRHEDIFWLIGESLQAILRDEETELTEDNVRQSLSEYTFAFFLDGLNEVAEDKRLKCTDAIRAFINLYDKHQYVITSRKHGYVPRLDYETLEILELSLEDISQYVARYLNKTKAQKLVAQLSPQLRRIAQNPLVLRIMIDVFQEKRQLPRSRGRLFERFVHLMLERDVAERSASLNYSKVEDINLKIKVCIPIGYWMQTGGQFISEAEALKLIEAELNHQNRNDILATKIVDDLCNSRLLEKNAQGHLKFWHQTVQEYFAASRISEEWRSFISENSARKNEANRNLDHYIKKIAWHETFAIGAGLLDDSELISLTLYLKKRNMLLMAMCLGNSENIPEKAEKSIITDLYNSLRVWRFISPEPIWVFSTSVPVILVMLAFLGAYFLSTGKPFLLYQFGADATGYQMICTVAGKNLVMLTIPIGTFLYQILVFYWSMPSQILVIANRVVPSVLTWLAIYLLWKGLNRLNDRVFARQVYNRLTAFRYIGTLQARDALAKLSLETQSNRWVHPQYKTAILAAQMVSADTESELLSLLVNKESQLYAIEVLGDVATDKAVANLYPMVDNSDDLVARGAVRALAKVANKREYQRRNVFDKFTTLIHDRTRLFGVRYAAYQGLKGMGVTDVKYPFPTWNDIQYWEKGYRPYYGVTITGLIVIVMLIMTFWEKDVRFFSENFSEPGNRFAVTDDDLGKTDFVDGKFQVSLRKDAFLEYNAYVPPDSYQDVYLSADVTVHSGGGAKAGLLFRMTDWYNFYFLTVDVNRSWALHRMVNGIVEVLYHGGLPVDTTIGVKHISVSITESVIRVSINRGIWVTIVDPAVREGRAGLIVFRGENDYGDILGSFDNLRVQNPYPVWFELPHWLLEQREFLVIGSAILLVLVLLALVFSRSIFVKQASHRDLLQSFVSSTVAYWLILAFLNSFGLLSPELWRASLVIWGIFLIASATLYWFRWNGIHLVVAAFFTIPFVFAPLMFITATIGITYIVIILTVGTPILVYSLLSLKDKNHRDLGAYIIVASLGAGLGGGLARTIGVASGTLLPGMIGSMADAFFEGAVITGCAIAASRWFELTVASKLQPELSSDIQEEDQSRIRKLFLRLFPAIGEKTASINLPGAMAGGGLGLSLVWIGVYSNAINIGVTSFETILGEGLLAGMYWFGIIWLIRGWTAENSVGTSIIFLVLVASGMPLLVGSRYFACLGAGMAIGLVFARRYIAGQRELNGGVSHAEV